MAKARVSTNPMYTGGAGGYSFYVRGGEQVVRQRRNNSNYGESASRSEAQQSRRVRWGNLVNFYKCISNWQPKAYETKKSGQTDYNLFMSLNMGYTQIALTKDMALNGCACVAGYTVSRGSLPTIEHDLAPDEGSIGYQINLTQAISSSTTVAQFSSDVIANNPQFKAGDNLAFIIFNNLKQSDGYPYVSSLYAEVTLDAEDSSLLSSKVGYNRFAKSTGNLLKLNVGAANSNEAGAVLIHTRKVSGALQVSTQSILVTSEAFWQEFAGDAWVQVCIDSYGVDQSVPLDPGAGGNTGAWHLKLSTSFIGDDPTGTLTDVFQLPVGRYRMTINPSVWEIGEEVQDSSDVFYLTSSTTPSFSQGTTQVIKQYSVGAIREGGVVGPFEFNVTQSGLYFLIGGHAAEGVTVNILVMEWF